MLENSKRKQRRNAVCVEVWEAGSEKQDELLEVKAQLSRPKGHNRVSHARRGGTFNRGTACSETHKVGQEPQEAHSALR